MYYLWREYKEENTLLMFASIQLMDIGRRTIKMGLVIKSKFHRGLIKWQIVLLLKNFKQDLRHMN